MLFPNPEVLIYSDTQFISFSIFLLYFLRTTRADLEGHRWPTDHSLTNTALVHLTYGHLVVSPGVCKSYIGEVKIRETEYGLFQNRLKLHILLDFLRKCVQIDRLFGIVVSPPDCHPRDSGFDPRLRSNSFFCK